MAKARVKKTITQRVEIDIDEKIDVNINDVFDGMNEFEKAEMLDYLVDEMTPDELKDFIQTISGEEEKKSFQFSKYDTFSDTTLADALIRIFNSRIKLSNNQIDALVTISNHL